MPQALPTINVGVLIMHPEPRVFSFFERVLNQTVETLKAPAQLRLRPYNVLAGQLPSTLRECDCYLLSGSPESVYDTSVPWVPPLLDFVREVIHAPVPREPEHEPDVRLIGICFGHQAIGAAVCNTRDAVRKAEVGWGIGPRTLTFDAAAAVAADAGAEQWMLPSRRELTLLYSHQDQIVDSILRARAPSASVLARTSFCPVEAMLVRRPPDRPGGAQGPARALSFQAHVEFSIGHFQRLYESRARRIGRELVDAACAAMQTCASRHGMCDIESPTPDDVIASSWIVRFATSSKAAVGRARS